MLHFTLIIAAKCLLLACAVQTSSNDIYDGFQAEPFDDGMTFHVIYGIDENENFHNNILQPVLDIWKRSLRPRNRNGQNLLIPRKCDTVLQATEDGKLVCPEKCLQFAFCGEQDIPFNLLDACYTIPGEQLKLNFPKGAGVTEDFILFVNFVDGNECTNREASAQVCSFDLQKSRPITGSIRLCSSMLTNWENSTDFYRTIVSHELVHLLGFNEDLYSYFRYRNGTFRTANVVQYLDTFLFWKTPDKNTIDTIKLLNTVGDANFEIETPVIVLPAVVDVARKYFGCNELFGVPLENQGLENRLNKAHFETRILAEELMSAFTRGNSLPTNFTLSLLLETGWYDVSHSVARKMTWGRNAGCDFVMKNCYGYMNTRRNARLPLMPFCDWNNIKKPACTPDRSRFSFCEMQQFDVDLGHLISLPPIKYNGKFKNTNFGGVHVFEDYCPSLMSGSDTRAWDRITQNCKTEPTTIPMKLENPAMETFGVDSICIDHIPRDEQQNDIRTAEESFEELGASCHKYRCVIGTGLQLLFGSAWVNCPMNGGIAIINVSRAADRLMGEIFCPSCEEFCEQNACTIDSTSP